MKKLEFKSHHWTRLLAVAALAMGGVTMLAAPSPQAQSGTVQAATVTGQVLDENGEPMIGATVSVKGTSVGTATDFDGRFSISAAQGATLTVSYVGYGTRNVRVDGTNLTITMEPTAACDLSEVVVTALGIKKDLIEKRGRGEIFLTDPVFRLWMNYRMI